MGTALAISLIVLIILFIIFMRLRKVPKCGSLTLITGGVKSGKSTLAVHLTIRHYKKVLLKWKIYRIIRKVLRFLPEREKPLLYSNVPLAGIDYVELTEDLLLREKRFAYRSVIYCQEASLVADSQQWRDMDVNERLLHFNKLIGHETRGGMIIYDTQSIQDCHYAIKRSVSSYIWIHHNIKIPFFVLVYVREMFYSEDGSGINVFNEDVEETLLRIIIPKSIWKRFDAYCYSKLTDHLPAETKTKYIPKRKLAMTGKRKRELGRKLRTDKIVSVRRAMKKEKEEEIKKAQEKEGYKPQKQYYRGKRHE